VVQNVCDALTSDSSKPPAAAPVVATARAMRESSARRRRMAERSWKRLSFRLGFVVLLVILAGCGEDQAPQERTAAPAEQPVAAMPAGSGTIQAEVKYAGPADVETVRVNKDVAQCGREQQIEKVVVGADGGLAGAVVSLAGPRTTAAKPPNKPTLDQKGCQFRPHVLAMQPGEVDILNSDGILHNIHTHSTANPAFNKAQPKFKKVMTEELEKPEFIRVQCDVHSWMQSWIAVMPNQYFGVTGDTGRTTVAHVPAGRHTVEVWHPVLGTQRAETDVKAGETITVTFHFKP
jgi:plastocyanin